jgi:hypothetical protein
MENCLISHKVGKEQVDEFPHKIKKSRFEFTDIEIFRQLLNRCSETVGSADNSQGFMSKKYKKKILKEKIAS